MVKQINTSLMILSAFLAGACSILVAQPLIVPPAHADTNPQKWEYSCGWYRQGFRQPFHEVDPKFDEVLQEYGRNGWEMIDGAESYCFKRPLS